MKYRKDLEQAGSKNKKANKITVWFIKVTVFLLTVSFLVTVALMIINKVKDPSGGNGGSGGGADRVAPVLTLIESGEGNIYVRGNIIYITVGEDVSWRSVVTVTDESGTAKIVEVDDRDVNLDQVGEYTVTYTAKDNSGNTSTLTVKVCVTKAEYSYGTLMSLVARKVKTLGIDGMDKQKQIIAVYEYVNSPSKSATDAEIMWFDKSNIPDIDRDNWESDWIEEATRTLNNAKGDCYSYYSVSKAFFEYLGIEHIGIERDNTKTKQSGTHFWLMVNIGTKESPQWYHYDATRLAGTFGDGTHNGCLRTSEELRSYVTSKGEDDFYAWDESQYPATASKISR